MNILLLCMKMTFIGNLLSWLIPSKLPDFWNAFDKHPLMTDSPLKTIPEYTTNLIPLSLHGDEVPVFGVGKIWARSVLSFSWTSILANALGAKAEDCTIYIWGVFEKFCVQDEGGVLGTMSTFFSILRWSFQTLLDGVWPTHDWRGIKYEKKSRDGRKAGLPLAGGYRACLLQLCGDLDFSRNGLAFLRAPITQNRAANANILVG